MIQSVRTKAFVPKRSLRLQYIPWRAGAKQKPPRGVVPGIKCTRSTIVRNNMGRLDINMDTKTVLTVHCRTELHIPGTSIQQYICEHEGSCSFKPLPEGLRGERHCHRSAATRGTPRTKYTPHDMIHAFKPRMGVCFTLLRIPLR